MSERRIRVGVIYGANPVSRSVYTVARLLNPMVPHIDPLSSAPRVATVIGVRNGTVFVICVRWWRLRTYRFGSVPVISRVLTISIAPSSDDAEVLRELVAWSAIFVGGSARVYLPLHIARALGMRCEGFAEAIIGLRSVRLCAVRVDRPRIEVEPMIVRLPPSVRGTRVLEEVVERVLKGSAPAPSDEDEGGEEREEGEGRYVDEELVRSVLLGLLSEASAGESGGGSGSGEGGGSG